MGPSQSKKLHISSRLSEVASVQKAVVRQMEAIGNGPEVQFAVRLALDEALANAIHHGNRDDPTKRVTVTYRVTPAQVRISVLDEGRGFDPSLVPDPRLSENLCKPNGRGIMLMRAYMTCVNYNHQGNCVTLIKKGALGPGSS